MSAPPWLKPTGVLDPEKHGHLINSHVQIEGDAHSAMDTSSTFVQSIAQESVP